MSHTEDLYMLYAEDLFQYIANELGYSQAYLSKCIGVSVATVSKWNKHIALPSQDMYRTMLHFANIMGVDCSYFTIELYINRVIEVVYNDEYFQYQPIDWTRNRVFLRSAFNGERKIVNVEDFTNKKVKAIFERDPNFVAFDNLFDTDQDDSADIFATLTEGTANENEPFGYGSNDGDEEKAVNIFSDKFWKSMKRYL